MYHTNIYSVLIRPQTVFESRYVRTYLSMILVVVRRLQVGNSRASEFLKRPQYRPTYRWPDRYLPLAVRVGKYESFVGAAVCVRAKTQRQMRAKTQRQIEAGLRDAATKYIGTACFTELASFTYIFCAAAPRLVIRWLIDYPMPFRLVGPGKRT